MPTYGVERVRQLISHIHPAGHLLLLRARDCQGRCVATGIFPHLNGMLYFWGGASWRTHRDLRPNEAIQWEAMRIGKRKGLRTYDMGGEIANLCMIAGAPEQIAVFFAMRLTPNEAKARLAAAAQAAQPAAPTPAAQGTIPDAVAEACDGGWPPCIPHAVSDGAAVGSYQLP